MLWFQNGPITEYVKGDMDAVNNEGNVGEIAYDEHVNLNGGKYCVVCSRRKEMYKMVVGSVRKAGATVKLEIKNRITWESVISLCGFLNHETVRGVPNIENMVLIGVAESNIGCDVLDSEYLKRISELNNSDPASTENLCNVELYCCNEALGVFVSNMKDGIVDKRAVKAWKFPNLEMLGNSDELMWSFDPCNCEGFNGGSTGVFKNKEQCADDYIHYQLRVMLNSSSDKARYQKSKILKEMEKTVSNNTSSWFVILLCFSGILEFAAADFSRSLNLKQFSWLGNINESKWFSKACF